MSRKTKKRIAKKQEKRSERLAARPPAAAAPKPPKAPKPKAAAKAPKAGGEVILEVKDLRTTFHTPNGPVYAVQGLSFELRRGEILGIVGESGSGKSVTNLSIMGLIRPPGVVEASTVRFKGRELLGLPDAEMRKIRGDRIAMIFQDPMTSLNPFLTVGDQIAESLVLHRGMSNEAALARAVELLDQVGIPGSRQRVHQYPHEFSGGMRQRVMIAMALACDPEVLIADEPTTALDVTIQAQILDLIKRLRDELGMAVILITHDLGVVAGSCDRTIVMYSGRIAEANDTRPLFKAPQHPYTEALLRSIPRADRGHDEELDPIPGSPPDLGRLPTGCPFAPRCRYAEARCEDGVPALEAVGARGLKACKVNWRGQEA